MLGQVASKQLDSARTTYLQSPSADSLVCCQRALRVVLLAKATRPRPPGASDGVLKKRWPLVICPAIRAQLLCESARLNVGRQFCRRHRLPAPGTFETSGQEKLNLNQPALTTMGRPRIRHEICLTSIHNQTRIWCRSDTADMYVRNTWNYPTLSTVLALESLNYYTLIKLRCEIRIEVQRTEFRRNHFPSYFVLKIVVTSYDPYHKNQTGARSVCAFSKT